MRTQHGYVAIFCLFAFGCADAQVDDDPDSSFDGGASDAEGVPSVPKCPEYLPDHCGDTCVSLADDPNNCGTCAHGCGGLFSDYECTDYECRCGDNAGECGPTSVCFNGMCVFGDDLGEPCDNVESQPCTDPEFDCIFRPDLGKGFCTRIKCSTEVCNGRDDDCDGESDEVEDTTESCYSGPAGTEDIGICTDGYRVCVWNEFEQGMTECMGEALPIAEVGLLACDGLDNDCDNCADGRWEDGDCVSVAPTRFDVVFFLDISDSMDSTIANVLAAMSGFVTTYASATNINWGLVVFPVGSYDSSVEVRQDLSSYTDFLTALSGITTSGGPEANWDVIYMAATDDAALPLTFTTGAQRVYIMFTDEVGQSYYPDFSYYETYNIDEATMCASLTDEVFAVFSAPVWSSEFDDCGISGSPFPLDSFTSTEDLVSNIELTFGSACGE